ncbi:MAG: hypothetical protein E7554_00595 [Ruminococcaceae bacterium]|nr:hypothetical protein [Oscillospiraceae bacterium]
MLLVNPQQLTAESHRLIDASAALLRAYDSIGSVTAEVETQKPLDSIADNLRSVLVTIEKQIETVVRMSRALEQVSTTYSSCERTIESSCTPAPAKSRVDALRIHQVQPLMPMLD